MKTHSGSPSASLSIYIYVLNLGMISPLLSRTTRSGRSWAVPISQFFFFLPFFSTPFRIGYVAEETNPDKVSVSSLIGSRLGS